MNLADRFMQQTIESRVTPDKVWEAWEKAHAIHGEKEIEAGLKGKTKLEGKRGFKYRILAVDPGKSFSILWKSLFVRLIFTHSVSPIKRGSQISYNFKIQGPFAWPVRWLLTKKIQKNLSLVLKAFVKQLEGKKHDAKDKTI